MNNRRIINLYPLLFLFAVDVFLWQGCAESHVVAPPIAAKVDRIVAAKQSIRLRQNNSNKQSNKKSKGDTDTDTYTKAKAKANRGVSPVSRAQANYYKTVFPYGSHFIAKSIPKRMLGRSDVDNNIYIEVRDVSSRVIGYLRDYLGPVTFDEACECAPLHVTMAFDERYQFITLISPAPLTKLGHDPMTEADFKRLIDIVAQPDEALLKVRRTKSIVDAVSGATKKEFIGKVVEDAGLSTHRLVTLVKLTRQVLQGAPIANDQHRLSVLLEGVKSAANTATSLAKFIPTADTPNVRAHAFRIMLRAYREALRQQRGPFRDVEARILLPRIDPEYDAAITVDACYQLANAGLRMSFADRCVGELKITPGADPAAVARLEGSLFYFAGEMKNALSPLIEAAQKFPIRGEAQLHLRLTETYAALAKHKQACTIARKLFTAHPLLPGVKRALESCIKKGGKAKNVAQVIHRLRKNQAEALLASRLQGGARVPVLELEGKMWKPEEIDLATPGKVTVAVFFATWCPHCQIELPRIISFVRALKRNKKLKGKVRIVGIRTSVEKEKIPYEEFEKQFSPNFPIFSDPVMSLAFSKFAKSQNISAGLPTLVVVNERGQVVYNIASGDHRDIARDLLTVCNEQVSEL